MTNHQHQCGGGCHKETKKEGCGCGHNHNHEHEHENKGGCGSHDHHEHNHGCGCGCGDKKDKVAVVFDKNLTKAQVAFMNELANRNFLPVARFVVKSKREPDFQSIALAPVFIRSLGDTMATVKEAEAFLKKLVAQGMITIEYDKPVKGYDYKEYHDCDLYAYFCETVAEAKGKANFLGDTPTMELGSMGLSDQAFDYYENAMND